jgi:hypothetical protein
LTGSVIVTESAGSAARRLALRLLFDRRLIGMLKNRLSIRSFRGRFSIRVSFRDRFSIGDRYRCAARACG